MKKIKFYFDDEFETCELPTPAKNNLPEWYKKAVPYTKGQKFHPQKSGPTIKSCLPFADSMLTGYTLKLWTDLYAHKDSVTGEHYFTWNNSSEFIKKRTADGVQGFPPPPGYDPQPLAFKNSLMIETPPGYSVLITHPLNRFDSPIICLSGIVDTDIHPLFPGYYPFYIKKDFDGLIERGTPLLQIIPFKRDTWQSEKSLDMSIKAKLSQKDRTTIFNGWYRKNGWSKKKYD
jgi:hypothetical protein